MRILTLSLHEIVDGKVLRVERSISKSEIDKMSWSDEASIFRTALTELELALDKEQCASNPSPDKS